MKPQHPKAVLYRELLWLQDPRAKKISSVIPGGRNRYRPTVILMTLLSVFVFITERDGVGFPGDAEDCALGYALASLWKRPKHPAGHPVPLRATTRRLLGQRIRANLGVYLLTAARQIVAERQREEAAKPRRYEPEPPPTKVLTPTARPSRIEALKARYGVLVQNS
jgi:hypothetical protein